MFKYIPFFIAFLVSFSSEAKEENSQSLDEMMSAIKLARLNTVKAELPDGTHWTEGYFQSGLFYPCSNKHGLWLQEKESEKLKSNIGELVHVEFTASFSNGLISIIEVHSIANEHPSNCKFNGQ